MTNQKTTLTDYWPYHTYPEFEEGITDYMKGRYQNPYTGSQQGLAAEAWDKGLQYAYLHYSLWRAG
jgi:hypothetical protein